MTRHNPEPAEIPQLEENLEEEQYQDLETYLTHHNTFEASQRICRDYRSRLLVLDNDILSRSRQSLPYLRDTPSSGL